MFDPVPVVRAANIVLWFPVFRTWGEDYEIFFEIRTSDPFSPNDVKLMAYRDDERERALGLVVTYPDGRRGTPDRPGELAVTIAGHQNDRECAGTIHVDAAPPDGPVRLAFSWPLGGLGATVVDIPGRQIAAESSRVINDLRP